MTVLEIRTYLLRPGTTEAFHRTITERSVPLLAQFGIDVVRAAPSEVSEDGEECYVLIRAFESVEQHAAQEDRFYRSPEWHEGPRADVLAPIQGYHTIVLTVPDAAVEALRPAR